MKRLEAYQADGSVTQIVQEERFFSYHQTFLPSLPSLPCLPCLLGPGFPASAQSGGAAFPGSRLLPTFRIPENGQLWISCHNANVTGQSENRQNLHSTTMLKSCFCLCPAEIPSDLRDPLHVSREREDISGVLRSVERVRICRRLVRPDFQGVACSFEAEI